MSSGAALIPAARRARLAWRLVRTGKGVPLTFSKRSTGRRLSSFSILTTNAVISKEGSISFETMTNSSGFLRLTRSRKLRRSCAMSDSVEAAAVVRQDLLLLLVADVAALANLVDRARVAVVPVREIGCPYDLVFADQLERLRQEPLVRLAREVDVAALGVLARLLLERRRLRGALGVLVGHALHPVRCPAAAGLEKRDAQVGEALGDSLEDHRRELPHLAEGVRAGVRLDESREQIDAGATEMRAGGVDAEHHAEAIRFLVHRQKACVAQEMAAISREHRADHPEVLHRAS